MNDLPALVLEVGRRAGLDPVGICDATPFERERREIERRREAGLHGGMAFTFRNPARSTDPSATLPGARSIVTGALHHPTVLSPRPDRTAAGRVARYATRDHYASLRAALGEVREVLRNAGHRAVVVADDNALVDRAAAVRAGLGWTGRSANVLVPGRGSWFLLGSVITDAELEPTGEELADGCGTCRRCHDGCPTGAIVAPGVVDARRCLSWLLQQQGELPVEYRVALGDRIYGCDECQEVCPPARVDLRRDPQRDDGVGGPGEPGGWVDLVWMLRADDDELLGHLGRWYVPRRDPRYLRRNALVVYGNVLHDAGPLAARSAEVDEVLGRHLDGGDDLLVGHAAWAALRAGRADLLDNSQRAADPLIAEELSRWHGSHSGGETHSR